MNRNAEEDSHMVDSAGTRIHYFISGKDDPMIRAPLSRLFRQVNISQISPCIVYIHSLPGFEKPMETFREEMWRCGITRIICLAPLSDVEDFSRGYIQAIRKGIDTWKYEIFEVPDFGIPEDRDAYLAFVSKIAGLIRNYGGSDPTGSSCLQYTMNRLVPSSKESDPLLEHILIHCIAGVGRSGTFTVILLLALGYPRDEAELMVKRIGSGPENSRQKEFIDWCELELRKNAESRDKNQKSDNLIDNL